MSKFQNRGNKWLVFRDDALKVHDLLPPKTYRVTADPINGLHLECIDDLDVPNKTYGDLLRYADRIYNTFSSRNSTTGVLLAGDKGSGKTLLAKQLSKVGRSQGIPTIVVGESELDGDELNTLIQSIQQPCIILFDEFEKLFPNDALQTSFLSLLDGVYSSKKLIILTCNDPFAINNNFINRPGRLFYYIEYSGIDEAVVREYCKDHLKNQSNTEDVVKAVMLFTTFSFDQLVSLIEEMNRYNEGPKKALELMNIRQEGYATEYVAELFAPNGQRVTLSREIWNFDPFNSDDGDGSSRFYVARKSRRPEASEGKKELEKWEALEALLEETNPEDPYFYFGVNDITSLSREGITLVNRYKYKLVLKRCKFTSFHISKYLA